MFNEARTTDARTESTDKAWRAVVVGAAVPFAMLAAAPAVSAAEVETHEVQTVNSEQLPPAPGLPDPQALLDLQKCLTDLQAALPAEPPVAAPVEAEQLPGLPLPDPGAPAVPDIGALNEICQQVLATVTGAAPPVAPPAAPGTLRTE
ncbi:hypothetical protein [Glycomyces tritici]|uniref:Secreted protein n=1 Tax=Glycomyces tritici TaxID=2665176 RepID=A0ABT7YJQ8_9ACTN|nr:hypothetical protein [Glycomyces tritici]MDN3238874.1 hypothetical protein [Glycomyces tritici]